VILSTLFAAQLAASPVLLWLPRLLIVWMFVESAIDKMRRFAYFTGQARQHNVPFPAIAIGCALVVEIAGSIALLTGQFPLIGLVSLSLYVLVVNFIYFAFWDFKGETAIDDRKGFLKNLAVAGGLLALAQASLVLQH
jgi:putative oxidoreductase